MKVFEYLDARGHGVYSEWYKGLQKRQRAALDAKIDAVRNAGDPGDARRGELPPNLFRGPVRHRQRVYPHTWKLTVNCDAALRPLACKGPLDDSTEWTILVPVIEVRGEYPDGCFQKAEDRRQEILNYPLRRREIRGDDDE